jgi:hypothetical protein
MRMLALDVGDADNPLSQRERTREPVLSSSK